MYFELFYLMRVAINLDMAAFLSLKLPNAAISAYFNAIKD
jgi:hypothetical protein